MSNKDEEERWARVSDFEAVLGAIFIGPGLDGFPKGLPFRPPPEELERTGLRCVESALVENISRISQYSLLPVNLYEFATRRHHLRIQTCLKETDTIDPPEDEQSAQRFSDRLEREERAWIGGSRNVICPFLKIIEMSDVSGMAAFHPKTTQPAIRAFCGSLIIQAWTMFESLSEDLWKAAVNQLPNKLALLKGKPRSKHGRTLGSSGMGKTDSAERAGPMVSVNDLQKYKFDLRTNMGKLLIETEKVSFRSLPSIRDAFHRAFCEQAKSIDDILDDPGLQYLSAVRNVLVHKSNRVDGEFLKQTSKVRNVPSLKEGDTFPLTGERTAELIRQAGRSSVGLLNAVHAWIVGHQKDE